MKERLIQTMLIWLFGGGAALMLAGLLLIGIVATTVPTPAGRPPGRSVVKGYFSDDRRIFFESELRENLEEKLKSLEKQTGVRLIPSSRSYRLEENEDANALKLMKMIEFGDKPPKKWLLLHLQRNYRHIISTLVGDKDVLSKMDKKYLAKIRYMCGKYCFLHNEAQLCIEKLIGEIRKAMTGSAQDPSLPQAN